MPKRKSKLRWKESGLFLEGEDEEMAYVTIDLSSYKHKRNWPWIGSIQIGDGDGLLVRAKSKPDAKRACKLLVEAMLRGKSK